MILVKVFLGLAALGMLFTFFSTVGWLFDAIIERQLSRWDLTNPVYFMLGLFGVLIVWLAFTFVTMVGGVVLDALIHRS